jgi:hypothetical protein
LREHDGEGEEVILDVVAIRAPEVSRVGVVTRACVERFSEWPQTSLGFVRVEILTEDVAIAHGHARAARLLLHRDAEVGQDAPLAAVAFNEKDVGRLRGQAEAR